MKQPLYLVAGLGKTGLSIARYLSRKHQAFILFDTREDAPGLAEFQQQFPDSTIYLNVLPTAVLAELTDIIVSPGLPLDLPFLIEARKQNIVIYGDIECLAREINAPVIAITGTNGKSTVTTLVGEMARLAGFTVAVAGNIGSPVLDMLADGQHYDLWVLELSSFQLDLTYSLAPHAATILNISPDHLDRHHTLDAYIAAKQRIYHQAKVMLYNRDERATTPIGATTGLRVSFGFAEPAAEQWGLVKQNDLTYLAKGAKTLCAVDSLKIKGIHNWLNALAACALAEHAGIAYEHMIAVLTKFTGLAHRCQWVRSLDGVEWINDSKGTNIGATVSAINGIGGSMHGKIVLIAGGQGKGADFDDLIAPVADFVRALVLIGEDADKMEQALAKTVGITHATSLESAVALAKLQAMPGDVVLLSPACASLDMFRDFNHRGDVFTHSVNGL